MMMREKSEVLVGCGFIIFDGETRPERRPDAEAKRNACCNYITHTGEYSEMSYFALHGFAFALHHLRWKKHPSCEVWTDRHLI